MQSVSVLLHILVGHARSFKSLSVFSSRDADDVLQVLANAHFVGHWSSVSFRLAAQFS